MCVSIYGEWSGTVFRYLLLGFGACGYENASEDFEEHKYFLCPGYGNNVFLEKVKKHDQIHTALNPKPK
jgi:hypothetical protein